MSISFLWLTISHSFLSYPWRVWPCMGRAVFSVSPLLACIIMSSGHHFVPRNLCFLEVRGRLGTSGALGCFSDGLHTPIVLTYLPNLCLINSSPGYRSFLLLGVNWWEKDVIFCVKNTVIIIEICGKSKSCVFVVNPLILPFSFLRLEMNT